VTWGELWRLLEPDWVWRIRCRKRLLKAAQDSWAETITQLSWTLATRVKALENRVDDLESREAKEPPHA
jgi:hypothetical protein